MLDTGIFDDDRYFDVFVEYAKATPEDILMRITVHNRGPEEANFHVLPQLGFRNTWSWKPDAAKAAAHAEQGWRQIEQPQLGKYRLDCDGKPKLLFCDNETNARRLYGSPAQVFSKTRFTNIVDHGNKSAVNPAADRHQGRRALRLNVPPAGGSVYRAAAALARRTDA